MWDMFAVIFIFFVLVLYAGITLVFVITGIRNWIWRPFAERISPRRSESNYGGVKSTRHEESAS